jgi:hypothetical protein
MILLLLFIKRKMVKEGGAGLDLGNALPNVEKCSGLVLTIESIFSPLKLQSYGIHKVLTYILTFYCTKTRRISVKLYPKYNKLNLQ